METGNEAFARRGGAQTSQFWRYTRFPHLGREPISMFAFFSNRLGCIGSIIVSLIGTALLLLLMRGCSSGF